jgi:hypothetical protein
MDKKWKDDILNEIYRAALLEEKNNRNLKTMEKLVDKQREVIKLYSEVKKISDNKENIPPVKIEYFMTFK